jgi:hypothetical protein
MRAESRSANLMILKVMIQAVGVVTLAAPVRMKTPPQKMPLRLKSNRIRRPFRKNQPPS